MSSRARLWARVLRDPLTHFLVVGALAFAVHRARAPLPRSRIAVREADVSAFAARLGTALTAESRAAVVSQLITEEALVREATLLRLPENDLVIRRRLQQTMTFLAESTASIPLPTDEELRKRFAALAKTSEEVFSVDHVFVRAGPDADGRARALLDALPTASAPQGDPFARGHRFDGKTVTELGGALGDRVAKAVPGLALAAWSGPFVSPLGLHLVRVTARTTRTVSFEDVKERLRVEELEARRAGARREVLHRLLARYEVELPDGSLRPAASLVP